jgi:hypothetical protein
VSSAFGQLAVMRHFNSGIDCAIAGAAMVAAPATPSPVTLIKSRRFMLAPSQNCLPAFFVEACRKHGTSELRFPSSTRLGAQKSPAPKRRPGGLFD